MQDGASNDHQKACRQCACAIPASAKLCSNCGSYQDWRGWLSVSSTVLALLVALLSVGTVAVPAITKALEQKESKIRISNVVLRDRQTSAVAVNSGQLPATIDEIAVHADRVLLLALPQTRNDTYLPSGAKQVVFEIKLKMSASTARNLAQPPKGKLQPDRTRVTILNPVAQIEFFITNSDGSRLGYRIPINIIDLGRLLIAHAERCENDSIYVQSGACSD